MREDQASRPVHSLPFLGIAIMRFTHSIFLGAASLSLLICGCEDKPVPKGPEMGSVQAYLDAHPEALEDEPVASEDEEFAATEEENAATEDE